MWKIEKCDGKILSIGPISPDAYALDDSGLETWLDISNDHARMVAAVPELLEALERLVEQIDLSKLSVKKDFSLMNAHAQASKLIHQIKHAEED